VPNKSRPPPIRNQLLAALPGKEYERLLPHLESAPLPFMGVLYESRATIKHVYFPGDGLISLLIVMDDGALREIGVVGNEGMLGVALALGAKTTLTRALVQLPGTAMRMKAGALLEELKRGGALPNVLRRYAHALFSQVSQSAACVSTHAVDRRLSRWLLTTHDHAPRDVFEMKHEFLATMLGVTRSVVTRAAGRLQQEKVIRYTRGQVTVLDRGRLEAAACECYEASKADGPRAGL
jgi:CRP-like cAMP-binding protein